MPFLQFRNIGVDSKINSRVVVDIQAKPSAWFGSNILPPVKRKFGWCHSHTGFLLRASNEFLNLGPYCRQGK